MARHVGTVTGRSTTVCGLSCHSGPRSRAARTQVATWARADKAASRSRSPGLKAGPVKSRRRILSDGRAQASRGQNPLGRVSWKTLASFASFPFSLFARSFFLSATSSDQERAKAVERGSHGASARAPQRVSTPPSSGLATALPWPSPASSCPRLGPSSPAPAKGHPDARRGRSVPPFPFSNLVFFSLIRTGDRD